MCNNSLALSISTLFNLSTRLIDGTVQMRQKFGAENWKSFGLNDFSTRLRIVIYAGGLDKLALDSLPVNEYQTFAEVFLSVMVPHPWVGRSHELTGTA